MIRNCPNCHAPLQDEAHFCPHCMARLDQKQQIEKPIKPTSNHRSILKKILIIVIVFVLVVGTILTYVVINSHKPICSYAQFSEAAPLVSHTMEIDSLWNPSGFKDIRILSEQNCIQYSTDVYLNDAILSLFFYNKGEKVHAYLSDVKQEDLQDAEQILKCIVQSVCNYYFTDIDEVFDNETVYPKVPLETPFIPFFTDALNRTDSYNQSIDNGGQITSNYIVMSNQNKDIIFCVTKRAENNSTLYDLSIQIERA